ncbi:MAG: DUF4870 domain-containing protein [Myxococcota bacterium]|nr:DUF4870 domain-containing protein [Myxococcota bacterium]
MAEDPFGEEALPPGFPSTAERNWAVFCHLGGFAGYVFPFGNVIAPLVLWLMRREESEYVEDHGREALNFQISITLYAAIAGVLILALIGIPLLIAVAIFQFVWMIIASVRASEGERYRYPLTLRLLS